jgi:hypothetical protein
MKPAQSSRRLWMLAAASSLLMMGACVTINIYFPAAAAEKAADRIIEEVYNLRREGAPAQAPGSAAPKPAASTPSK